MTFSPWLGDAEIDLFDDLVVPRYLSPFVSLVVEMLRPAQEPMLAHLGCRTGFLDATLVSKLPGSSFVGLEGSTAALARARGRDVGGAVLSYQLATDLPTSLTDATYSHVVSLHPLVPGEARLRLLEELERVLAPGGQALLALPLRGSFNELMDMLREFASSQDNPVFAQAIEQAEQARPTPETLGEELKGVGFDEVDVGVEVRTLSFASGRSFLDDPIATQLIFPDILSALSVSDTDLESAVAYVREAVATYWSDSPFELTLHVGCASACCSP